MTEQENQAAPLHLVSVYTPDGEWIEDHEYDPQTGELHQTATVGLGQIVVVLVPFRITEPCEISSVTGLRGKAP